MCIFVLLYVLFTIASQSDQRPLVHLLLPEMRGTLGRQVTCTRVGYQVVTWHVSDHGAPRRPGEELGLGSGSGIRPKKKTLVFRINSGVVAHTILFFFFSTHTTLRERFPQHMHWNWLLADQKSYENLRQYKPSKIWHNFELRPLNALKHTK